MNARTAEGYTPLIEALSGKQFGAATLLVENGADFRSATQEGWTADTAALYGQTALLKSMLDRGADVVHGAKGSSPLHAVANSDSPETLRLVLSQPGVEVNARDENGWTPLHMAANYSTAEVAVELIKGGADVNVRNAKGNRPLNIARRAGNEDVGRLLREHGATE